MKTLDPSHVRSLEEAGIGKRLHYREFSDTPAGEAIKNIFKDGTADAVKHEGKSLFLRGFSHSDLLVMARIFHMNGVGVRKVSLSKLFITMERRPSEAWEDIQDCSLLLVTPAQHEQPCPLAPWQSDLIGDYFIDRAAAGKSVALCFDALEPETPWWRDEFMKEFRREAVSVRAPVTK